MSMIMEGSLVSNIFSASLYIEFLRAPILVAQCCWSTVQSLTGIDDLESPFMILIESLISKPRPMNERNRWPLGLVQFF